MYFVNKR